MLRSLILPVLIAISLVCVAPGCVLVRDTHAPRAQTPPPGHRPHGAAPRRVPPGHAPGHPGRANGHQNNNPGRSNGHGNGR